MHIPYFSRCPSLTLDVNQASVYPRTLDPSYIGTYDVKWVKTDYLSATRTKLSSTDRHIENRLTCMYIIKICIVNFLSLHCIEINVITTDIIDISSVQVVTDFIK